MIIGADVEILMGFAAVPTNDLAGLFPVTIPDSAFAD